MLYINRIMLTITQITIQSIEKFTKKIEKRNDIKMVVSYNFVKYFYYDYNKLNCMKRYIYQI